MKVLKRDSKKTDSSKIPTLLNVDQNQDKQEVKLFFIAFTKECCLEPLTWYVNLIIIIGKLYINSKFYNLRT